MTAWRAALLLMLLTCSLLLPAAGRSQEQAAAADPARPYLLISAERLERLRALAKAQTPQWRLLLNWTSEPGRTLANPQDGPGLALAALVLKAQRPAQAQQLGRLAVACARAGAPSGQARALGRNTLGDPKRLGAAERLQEMGFTLLNPNLSQRQTWRLSRYTAGGFVVDLAEPPLTGVAKQGDTYGLLAEEPERADRLVSQVALTLDWAGEWFSPQDKQITASWLVAQARVFSGRARGGFDRRAVAAMHLVGLAGLACQGLHAEAEDLVREARQERFGGEILPCLQQAGEGGAWFEGSWAGAAAGLDLLEFAAAYHLARGEDLLATAPWFSQRLSFLVCHLLPGVEASPRGGFHQPMPDGDEVMSTTEAADLIRLQMLLLSQLRPQDPAAGWAAALYTDRRTPRVLNDHLLGLEFLWFEPEQKLAPLTSAPLSYLAPAVGRAFLRSDWSERATWLGFACGPHYAAAQHLDAGSLLLYRRGLLLARGGTFDEADSLHVLNYGLRTIAHNTVIVNDPQEYSWFDLREGMQKRGQYANDGGQRAWSLFDAQGKPTQGAPWTASGWADGPAPWEKLRAVYDVARVEALEEQPRFAYLRGRATAAYDGSTHKVSRLVRHVFHLRPGGTDDADSVEAVAVVDDLELAREQLSAHFVLHFPVRPEVRGLLTQVGPGRSRGAAESLRVTQGDSRLDVVCLLPRPSQVSLYGENGVADSWVQDRNYPVRSPLTNPAPWRVEFGAEAAKGRARPLVHVLLPGDVDAPAPPEVKPLSSPDPVVVGLWVADPRWPRVVVVRLGEPQAEATVAYDYPGEVGRHLVAGLLPGQDYQVSVQGGRVTLAPGQGLKASTVGLLAFRLRTPAATEAGQ